MSKIIIVGGGLAGGLIAKRLADRKFDFELLEASQILGGHHTWSYHETDLPPESRTWMKDLSSFSWNSHSVAFPKFQRTLPNRYCSLLSSDFHDRLAPVFGDRLKTNCKVLDLSRTEVTLQDGTILKADLVLDARGWSPQGINAYQKFVGLEVELEQDCGLKGPLLMDATVSQLDGFRFVYTLPFSQRRVLIEDTYYASQPDLNIAQIESRIWDYAEKKDWKILSILRKEVGCLPLPLTPNFPLSKRSDIPLPVGLRAGLFHATTGYSLPFAVATAELIYRLIPSGLSTVESGLRNWIQDSWDSQGFYRMLNRMLFWAAKPSERYKVLQKFYGLPLPTIERFYAGQNTVIDRARLLSGKPPVPMFKAAKAIFSIRSSP